MHPQSLAIIAIINTIIKNSAMQHLLDQVKQWVLLYFSFFCDYVNHILGVLLAMVASVIGGAYLANRVNDRLIGTVYVYVFIVICLTTDTKAAIDICLDAKVKRPILARLPHIKDVDNVLSKTVVIMQVVNQCYGVNGQ